MPPSVNEQLFDRSIRHATFLARLSSGEANKIVRFLDREVYPDLIDMITRRLNRAGIVNATSLRSTKALRKLQDDINRVIREGNQEAYRILTASLRDIAVGEASFTQKIIQDLVEPFLIPVNVPSDPILRSIVTKSMIRGEFLREEFAGMTARTRRGVVSAINIGLAEGEGVPEIVRRLRGTTRNPGGVLKASRHDATRIVRTAATHVTTQAREMTYSENSEIIKGVRWVATLDARTSQTCISLDGTVFGLDEGPRPPAHPFCRSTTTPVVKSYKELGLDLPDIPQTTRASMNGQVPANTTYPKWLRSQPVSVQDQVLGKRLAREWRAGRVSVDRFIDSNYRPLSLAEILKLEGLD